MADDAEAPRDAVPFVRVGLTSKALHFSTEEVQSRMCLRQPYAHDLRYTRTMMGFLMFVAAPREIAMIGLGGGSLAKFCYRYLPKARIDVVEINPKVIALRTDFQVPADGDRFRVVEADGAQFMRDTERRYDVVLLDAFGPQGLPRALSSQRFYDDCIDALNPGGLLVSNFHSAAPDFDACVQRIERSFDRSALVVTDGDARNSIAFARKGGALTASTGASAVRPKGLDDTAWTQLHQALEGVATALAGQPRRAGAAGGS